MTDKAKEAWRTNLIRIRPYTAGEQPDAQVIKLNANENPYPPSPQVKEALRVFDADQLRQYPQSDGLELVRALAAYHGIEEAGVYVSNGSDDVLALSFRAFFNSGRPILFPEITYSFYPVWCELFGIPYETVPLDAAFQIRSRDYMRQNGGVVLANPNAPTGIGRDSDFLRSVLSQNRDVIVMVDEAYVDFGGQTALPLIRTCDNLLVVQTFSKSRSLAGLRIGAAFGNPELIAVLRTVRNSFNSYPIDSIAVRAGVASLKDEAYFQQTVRRIVQTRSRTARRLRELGFDAPDTCTNFLFVTHPDIPARAIFARLRDAGILIRYFDRPGLDNHLRISIGTDAEMDALLGELSPYVQHHSGG